MIGPSYMSADKFSGKKKEQDYDRDFQSIKYFLQYFLQPPTAISTEGKVGMICENYTHTHTYPHRIRS